jgi:hypothetical protein
MAMDQREMQRSAKADERTSDPERDVDHAKNPPRLGVVEELGVGKPSPAPGG